MAERKDNLIRIIVEEYIRSANPVGSALIVEKYLPDLSSATIRNEMAELEAEGLIFQPHASAGRVPTLAGYQYYLGRLSQDGKLSAKNKKSLDGLKLKADRESVKSLAKALAEASDEAVLVGFGARDVYYTGISNLFRQPEFSENRLLFSMSEVIDHLDEVMARVFHATEEKPRIILGKSNPFGEMSAAILAKCRLGKEDGILGILGPTRMDYRENLGLMEYSQELLSKI